MPDPDCPACHGSGWVCEAHPNRPSAVTSEDDPEACGCGAPAEPCALCRSEDGSPPPVPFDIVQ